MDFKFIIKKLNNTLSKDEEATFNLWYNESAKHQLYFKHVKANYHNSLELINIEKAWHTVNKKIAPQTSKKPYWKYAAVALVAVLVSIPILLKNTKQQPDNNPVTLTNSIKPGSNKATLTLENGTEIPLENGQIFTSSNLKSTGNQLVYNQKNTLNSNKVSYNYLTIPRGGQFQLILSDGTKVWLNSETQLKYPVTFLEGATRTVELIYGEAYFDVTPSSANKGAKFIAQVGIQEIEVLGTEFNIKAYKDETLTHTTLVEGKVALNIEKNQTLLKPEEQFVFNKQNKNKTIIEVDVYSETAWKKGLFSFKSKSLKDIMKVLSRWYDVEITFEDKNLETIEFKGVLSKNQNIEDILKLIKNTNFINAYEIKNNHIVIKN